MCVSTNDTFYLGRFNKVDAYITNVYYIKIMYVITILCNLFLSELLIAFIAIISHARA